MKITTIKNAQVVTERGIIWDGIIVIEDGKIKEYGEKRDVEIPEDCGIHLRFALRCRFYQRVV